MHPSIYSHHFNPDIAGGILLLQPLNAYVSGQTAGNAVELACLDNVAIYVYTIKKA